MSRLRLLPAVTIALWALNVAYVLADLLVGPRMPDSPQRLMLAVALTATVACLLRHVGVEYRIGYRHGQADAAGTDRA